MRVLAIDTATVLASVALVEGDTVIAESSVSNIKTHSRILMPMISKVFEIASLRPRDIDAIGVSIGPGSFTGVRIGVATAKGMAISLKKPLIGVSTLDGLAQNTPFADGIICPILDAREGQVNNALYRFEKYSLKRLTDYRVLSIYELIEELMGYTEKIIMSGDGVFLYRDVITNALSEKVFFAPVNAIMPRATSIAYLASERIKRGIQSASGNVVPIYLKKSYAERIRENKNENGSK